VWHLRIDHLQDARRVGNQHNKACNQKMLSYDLSWVFPKLTCRYGAQRNSGQVQRLV